MATETLNPIIEADAAAICQELSGTLTALSGTTLLVTGGSGFLCSYLLETAAYLNDHFLAEPCRVISIDNLRSGLAQRTAHLAERPEFRFVQHDVSQPLALGEPVDWIVHGAGIGSPTFYRRYPLETIDVNASGTRHMLDLARQTNARSLLYISTSEIYGDPDAAHIPTREDYRGNVSCTGPRACYDESKRMAETLCWVYHELHRVPVKAIRPFNVYGPGQRLDDKRIIPDLVSAALERRAIELFSDGRATRSFCYVSDAIRALWLILLSDANGEAFNVGNDEREIAIGELAELISQVAGPPRLEIRHRISEDKHYLTDNPQRRCPDLGKLRGRLGWSPKVPLAEGLERTLHSYRGALQSAR
ncbi:MAG: NAD-dependent epimerase/dehydratase family protein [Bryobacteraceae bacterium]